MLYFYYKMYKGRIYWIAFEIIIRAIFLENLCYAESNVLTLEDILPDDKHTYDKMRAPKISDEPTVVNFHVTIMGLDTVDEKSMTFTLEIFFAQIWSDHRLKVPENMTEEYRSLEVDWLKNLWHPDPYFKNAKTVNFQTITLPNHYLLMSKDKVFLYMIKLSITLFCTMDFVIFPHDTQKCKMQMESLSHTTDDLIFEWDSEIPTAIIKDNIGLPQLQLVEYEIGDCTQMHFTGNISCLEVVFIFKRRINYYILNTFLPSSLIVMATWVSFWVKPVLAPARVTVCITSMLALILQQTKVQSSLPPISYITAIDFYLQVCMVIVFSVLMEYALVNYVLGEWEAPPKPRPGKRILTFEERKLRAISVDKFSRVFYPFLFTILNAAYWMVFSKYM